MKETYYQQKERHSKEINDFTGLFFAFSNEQLKEGLVKVGLEPDCKPTEFIVSIGAGGFILKTQLKEFKDMFKRHDTERKQLKQDKKKLYDALVYELNNHEYCITGNPDDALGALGLTRDDVEPAMLKKACIEAGITD